MIFSTILSTSRSIVNTLPPLARHVKLSEEVGEYAEALLHKLDFLPHKQMKEPLIGEAADVIICTLDVLAAAYPEMTPDELDQALVEQIQLKSAKWERVMKIRHSSVNLD